jgi:hypothetical protein
VTARIGNSLRDSPKGKCLADFGCRISLVRYLLLDCETGEAAASVTIMDPFLDPAALASPHGSWVCWLEPRQRRLGEGHAATS